ncbi:hypothetical protein B7H01_10260 [Pandoraea apista]|nr:hypothetical protein B7H01_10260 [Pandoraea apista]
MHGDSIHCSASGRVCRPQPPRALLPAHNPRATPRPPSAILPPEPHPPPSVSATRQRKPLRGCPRPFSRPRFPPRHAPSIRSCASRPIRLAPCRQTRPSGPPPPGTARPRSHRCWPPR